jgi:hypothetical protein
MCVQGSVLSFRGIAKWGNTFIHMFFRNGSVGGCVGGWVLGVFGSVGGGVVCFELLSRVAFVFEHVFVCIGSCFFACKSVERSRLSVGRQVWLQPSQQHCH